MREHIYKIKQDLKRISERIKILKKTKLKYDQLNYCYPSLGLGFAKKYRNLRSPGRVMYNGSWVEITNTTSITDDMVKEVDKNHDLYFSCLRELHELQYEYRLLSIVYGQFRGKTREQIEPHYEERVTTFNPLTRKYVFGKDPVDWIYIDELKKSYRDLIAGGD